MFSVYCHENKTNGKVYVGITGQDPKHRWLNGGGYSKNKKFSNDIKRFGWDGFTHRIVADGLTEQQAVSIEKEMIAAYDARHLGYNNDDGGKYTPKRALCHEANEVKRGIVAAKYRNIGGAKDLVDCFEFAEKSGKDSQFCKATNMVVQTIIEIFKKDERTIAYADLDFICDFVWEWNRYWKISKFIQDNGEEALREIDPQKEFPKYNSRKRYEQIWNNIKVS